MDQATLKIYLLKEIDLYLKRQDQYKENKMKMMMLLPNTRSPAKCSKPCIWALNCGAWARWSGPAVQWIRQGR